MAVRAVSDRLSWVGPALAAAALAALAIGVAVAEQGRAAQVRVLDVFGIVLLLGGSLTLALPKRWAAPGYVLALISISAYQSLGYTIQSPYFLGLLFAAYRAAAPGHRRRSALLALLSLVLCGVSAFLTGRPELAYGMPSLVVAAFVAGQLVTEQHAATRRREAQMRAEQERRLVTEERLRIARELHDVISHSIATIGVQAGVAAHVLDAHPEQAREALRAIKAVSRDALRDLRGMLGVLREADDGAGVLASAAGAGEHEPAPGLARLAELVERVRGAGVQVGIDVSGEAGSLTPATDLAAYRVVQEALTNVLRHAPGAAVRVRVGYAPDQVSIEVIDDGGVAARPMLVAMSAVNGTGHGLAGLRERAATLGGTLEAGPLAAGGFRVGLRLPR